MQENCNRHGISPKELTDDAMRVLRRYPWPGNVRELENMVERICVMTTADIVGADDLPSVLTGRSQTTQAHPRASESTAEPAAQPTLKEIEKAYTYYILEHRADGQKKRAAEILGIDESTLHRRLDRYGKEEEGG